MDLGSFFPQEIKDNFAKRNIELGKTLLIEIPDFNISYKKYLIIVATNELLPFLKKYTAEEPIESFVIGQPKRLNNEDSDVEVLIQAFITQLRQEFPDIAIHRQDERFTSKIAFQTMIDSGLKKKQRQDKALIDEISATLILQQFLEKKINHPHLGINLIEGLGK